jgi:hypothetical protein
MATKNMLIIRDEKNEIIAAQIEDAADSDVKIFITPAQPQHTVHRVYDVPTEVYDIANPDQFHKAMTDHVNSGKANLTKTSADELHAAFAPRSKT